MSSLTEATIRKLALLNLSTEQMAGVLDILADIQAADDERRRKQRDRTAKHRRNVTVTLPDGDPGGSGAGNVDVTLQSRDCNTKEKSPLHPPKENISSQGSNAHARDLMADDFRDFWETYPHRVSWPTARDAYFAVREAGASHGDIIAGVQRYAKSKPSDRQWLNPARFLTDRRWLDKPGPTPTESGPLTLVSGASSHVQANRRSGNLGEAVARRMAANPLFNRSC